VLEISSSFPHSLTPFSAFVQLFFSSRGNLINVTFIISALLSLSLSLSFPFFARFCRIFSYLRCERALLCAKDLNQFFNETNTRICLFINLQIAARCLSLLVYFLLRPLTERESRMCGMEWRVVEIGEDIKSFLCVCVCVCVCVCGKLLRQNFMEKCFENLTTATFERRLFLNFIFCEFKIIQKATSKLL
jgi:hypothetical protein